jgi:serine/threonine-protein kinase
MKHETADLLGRQVGHIRVVDVLGEGGMGVVYAGFDNVLQRKVALKAIHSDFRLQDDAKARFLREARILSQLDHPHICTVHDLIEEGERDFLVLELVRGRNLRDAAEDDLDRPAKLRIAKLLLEVLVAVHGQGVVHRDLKPENVMVTKDGGIKVLDFGLSRSADEDGPRMSQVLTLCKRDASSLPETETDRGDAGDTRSVYVKTRRGTVLGTVGYMSPEQARGEPATTASDMYSLGLILQELFTGQSPFEPGLDSAALLKRASEGQTLPVTGLSADLTDFIERLKAYAPGARPSSIDALAALQRIIDRPKRRARTIIASAAVVVLAVFAVIVSYLLVRVSNEAERANLEAKTATQVSQFLQSVFRVSEPGKALGNTVTARELLDRAAERVETELVNEPLLQARMMDTIGWVYQTLGLYDQAEPLLERALSLRREHLAGDHDDLVISIDTMAVLQRHKGNYVAAERLSREAVAMEKRLKGDQHPDVADRLHNLAAMVQSNGDYDAAEALWRETLAIRRRHLGDDHQNTAMSCNSLGRLLQIKGDHEAAEPLLREAVTGLRRFFGDDHPRVASALNNLAITLAAKGDSDGAEEIYREVLAMRRRLFGDEHPVLAGSLNNLAVLLKDKGDVDQAESLFREALAMRRRLLVEEHPDVAQSCYNLARLLEDTNELDAAEPLFREALAIAEQSLPPDHPDRLKYAAQLANLLRGTDREAEATALEDRAGGRPEEL